MTSVRLPSDSGRAKGFGYAEFENRQSLLDALSFSDAVSLHHCSLILNAPVTSIYKLCCTSSRFHIVIKVVCLDSDEKLGSQMHQIHINIRQ